MKKIDGAKLFILILLIISIIGLTTTTFLYILKKSNDTNNKSQNNHSKYSEQATNTMKSINLYDKITKQEYSKTIEKMLETENFKQEYLEEYYKIEYYDIENFETTINTFLNKKYNSSEINYIIKELNTDLNILLNMDHINILQFKKVPNFDINKIERYLDYQEKNNYDLKTVVTYVNIGLDLPGYSHFTSYTNEEATNDITILVNKYHKLPDDYEPDDLIDLSYKSGNYTYKLRKEAALAFEKLSSAALIENVIFYPYSAYRSYETQNILYTRYKERDGEEAADTYSARPGHSEHQLGLAVDVRSNTLTSNLTASDYEWMLKNSYKYGFIIRYPKGKQHITQFIEEPWHLRYLGVDLATNVYESGLTYDEYYDLYLNEKKTN